MTVQVKFGWVSTDMIFLPNSDHSYHSARIPPGSGWNVRGRVKYSPNGMLRLLLLLYTYLLNLTSFSIWNISTLDTSSTAISNQRIFLSDEVPLFVLFISSTSVLPDGSVILALSFTPLTRRISR